MTANDLLRMGNKNGRIRKFLLLRNRHLLAVDTLGLLCIPSVAYVLRTESVEGLARLWEPLAVYTLGMILLKWFIFYAGRLYSTLWAYTSVHELLLVARTIGISAIAELAISYGIFYSYGDVPPGFPRSLPILSALITFFYITGIRFSVRVIYSAITKKDGYDGAMKRVLIAGAGTAGVMIARELQANPHLGMIPLGFVDDDPKKGSKLLCGIPVFGVIADIPWITNSRGVEEVIVAMPTAPGEVFRRVDRLCKEAGIPSKTTPGLYELASGAATIESVRQIQLEDLLRRDVVGSDPSMVSATIAGKRVLVTGAGGSIGSEIVRQLKGFRPSELVILGHGETSIFHIMKEMEEHRVAGTTVIPIVADIRDRERIDQVFQNHHPEIIFHAAAHKHVWLMEQNLPDAVTNNVMGTRVMVTLAEKYRVPRFVMISSDKAVNPTSVMGVTKRVAELIVQDAANRSGLGFITVRFGNVLGSRGSVIPIFRQQIAAGGPVTVTHPEVTRYFMTIPEAVHLVLQAGSMGTGGEVFVLDMGKQLKVLDVARDVIRLSGHTEEEVGIAFTGLKPGERMYEELFYETDTIETTAHPMVSVSRYNYAGEYASRKPRNGTAVYEADLRMDVDTLVAAAHQGDHDLMNAVIKQIVPQYTPAHEYMAVDPAATPTTPIGQTPQRPVIIPNGR